LNKKPPGFVTGYSCIPHERTENPKLNVSKLLNSRTHKNLKTIVQKILKPINEAFSY